MASARHAGTPRAARHRPGFARGRGPVVGRLAGRGFSGEVIRQVLAGVSGAGDDEPPDA